MNQVPLCSIHPFSPLQFIQVQKEKCNWICSSCYYNEKKTNQNEIVIDLFQVKQNPCKLQELFPQRFQQINIIKHPLEENKKSLETLKILMEDQICAQNDQESLIDVVQQLIFLGPKVDDDVKQQIEIKFQYHIQKLQQPDKEQLNNFLQHQSYLSVQTATNYENFKDNFRQIEKETQVHLDKISKLSMNDFACWLLQPIKQMKKQNFKFQIIYDEKGEKLDFEQFKQVIEGKKNLLMVFTSQNKGMNQFGVFTPYQWTLNQYQGEEVENTSFIFSFGQKQMFQIKPENSQWTQKLDDQSIRFGGSGNNDEDICIYKDFKTGFSELGKGFKALNFENIQAQKCYLFGGIEPNISGCIVCQVSFL